MSREVHVRFSESARVKFPRATRPLAFHPAMLSNLIDNNGRCAILYILAGRSLGFVSSPHLAGIVTIGAACTVPVSVSENRNIKKLNICFDCLSRSSIQNQWLR
jgi:hypothetical protein